MSRLRVFQDGVLLRVFSSHVSTPDFTQFHAASFLASSLWNDNLSRTV